MMLTKELKSVIGPTMTFKLNDMCSLHAPHNDVMVIQLKISTTMVCKFWWTLEP